LLMLVYDVVNVSVWCC